MIISRSIQNLKLAEYDLETGKEINMKKLITFFRKKIDELSCDDDFEFCDLKFLRENKKDFILFKNNISAIKKQLLPIKADLIKEDTILDIEMFMKIA